MPTDFGRSQYPVAPDPAMHIDLVALFGVEVEGDDTTPLAEPTLVAGWEF
ncbi:MAG: hypothetical protein R3C68_07255 [Myxococcota bacterium]